MKQSLFLSCIVYSIISLLLSSCFLVKVPIEVKNPAITDTVSVYHFIVSSSDKRLADTSTTIAFKKESKYAYNWISNEAKINGKNLYFRETWISNKDSSLGNTFIYKLPSNNLKVLSRKERFKIVIQKKTKDQKQVIEKKSWDNELLKSVKKQLTDSTIIRNKISDKSLINNINEKQIIVYHFLKAKKNNVQGFYKNGFIYLGSSKSNIVAHESIHYLGAPDIYIHKYWFGKRKRIVLKYLTNELMDGSIKKKNLCSDYFLSNYTLYTIGWTDSLDDEFVPLLKYNLMAKLLFKFSLFR